MTALEQHTREQRDRDHARRSAEQICYGIRQYIPDACLRDAIDTLAEAMHKSGIELTNADQRKRYESINDLMIHPGKIWPI
jgi:hypothetical protein